MAPTSSSAVVVAAAFSRAASAAATLPALICATAVLALGAASSYILPARSRSSLQARHLLLKCRDVLTHRIPDVVGVGSHNDLLECSPTTEHLKSRFGSNFSILSASMGAHIQAPPFKIWPFSLDVICSFTQQEPFLTNRTIILRLLYRFSVVPLRSAFKKLLSPSKNVNNFRLLQNCQKTWFECVDYFCG